MSKWTMNQKVFSTLSLAQFYTQSPISIMKQNSRNYNHALPHAVNLTSNSAKGRSVLNLVAALPFEERLEKTGQASTQHDNPSLQTNNSNKPALFFTSPNALQHQPSNRVIYSAAHTFVTCLEYCLKITSSPNNHTTNLKDLSTIERGLDVILASAPLELTGGVA